MKGQETRNWAMLCGSLSIILILILGLNSVKANFPNPDVDYNINNNRITEYYFNEGTGTTTRDDSGSGSVKEGTLYGDTSSNWINERESYSTGPLSSIDAAIEYDGDGDYIKVNENDDFNIGGGGENNFVVSAVINPYPDFEPGTPGIQHKARMTICSYYTRVADEGHPNDDDYDYIYGWQFLLIDGDLTFISYNGQIFQDPDTMQTIQYVFDISDVGFVFVACEYDGSDYNLYIEYYNGQQSAYVQYESNTEAEVFPGQVEENDFYIGMIDEDDNINEDYNYFFGVIDNLHIYEPISNYDSLYRVQYEQYWARGYWSFDEGSYNENDLVNDRVDNRYNCYGNLVDDVVFLSPGVKGENKLMFGQTTSGYVEIYDAPKLHHYNDLYIELYFSHDLNIPVNGNEVLIAKISLSGGSIINGYILYLNNQGQLIYEAYMGGTMARVSTPVNTIINGNEYHVWIYGGGVWYLHLHSGNDNHINEWSGGNTGQGSNTNNLYIGGHPTYYNGFHGYIDEVIIGVNE